MSAGLPWFNRIIRDHKGIWGIGCPSGMEFDVSLLAKPTASKCDMRFIRIVRIDNERFFFEKDENLSYDLAYVLRRYISAAEENDRSSLCVVITDFHHGQLNEQCAFVKTARALQESTTSISCQVVLVGRWGYFSFRSYYRELHGHTSSPAAESKNMLYVPAWNSDDVRGLLLEHRVVGAEHSDFDQVAIDFLVEQTAGDEFLIRRAVDDLVLHSGDWKENLEHVLTELASSDAVTSEIRKRLRSLGSKAITELRKLLLVHRIIRDYESIVAEELWLSGLVNRRKLDGTKSYVQVAGPIVNTIVRHILLGEDGAAVAEPKHLCFDRQSISAAAYRNVAVIENMLRNLVVCFWHSESGDAWSSNLGATRTSSRFREDEEEFARYTMAIVKTELAAIGIGDKDARLAVTENSGGVRQVSVLDSARDWQKRQEEHHGVDLANTSVMHFLTTEALESVLCSKKNGLHGDKKPFKKEALIALLEEYRAIRSAIAHNQPVKLNTIPRLEDILRKIIEWNTVFADQPGAQKSAIGNPAP